MLTKVHFQGIKMPKIARYKLIIKVFKLFRGKRKDSKIRAIKQKMFTLNKKRNKVNNLK